MQQNKQVSEIDNMAITGILSTQLLHHLFVERHMEKLTENDLVNVNKSVIE